jgi:hypothetical protein
MTQERLVRPFPNNHGNHALCVISTEAEEGPEEVGKFRIGRTLTMWVGRALSCFRDAYPRSVGATSLSHLQIHVGEGTRRVALSPSV